MTRPIRRVFPGRHDQVRCARDFVRRVVGPNCSMLDEAVLLTSELCTNALQHSGSGAGGTFEVTVLRGPGCARIEVRDEGSKSLPAAETVSNCLRTAGAWMLSACSPTGGVSAATSTAAASSSNCAATAHERHRPL